MDPLEPARNTLLLGRVTFSELTVVSFVTRSQRYAIDFRRFSKNISISKMLIILVYYSIFLCFSVYYIYYYFYVYIIKLLGGLGSIIPSPPCVHLFSVTIIFVCIYIYIYLIIIAKLLLLLLLYIVKIMMYQFLHKSVLII